MIHSPNRWHVVDASRYSLVLEASCECGNSDCTWSTVHYLDNDRLLTNSNGQHDGDASVLEHCTQCDQEGTTENH